MKGRNEPLNYQQFRDENEFQATPIQKYGSPPSYSAFNEPSEPFAKNDEKFPPPEKQHYRDSMFLLLFLLTFVAFVALFAFGLIKRMKGDVILPTPDNNHEGLQLTDEEVRKLIYVSLGSLALGALISVLWLFAMQKFPKALIYISLFFTVGISLLLCIVSFYYGQIWAGILMILITILNIIFLYCVRARIPFAVAMLKTVVKRTKEYPAMIGVTYFGLFVQTLFIALWCVTVVLVTSAITSDSGLYAAVIFFIFVFYWMTQVVKNVVHVTCAGTFATWYFYKGTEMGVPRNPTLGAFKRATTTSLGSICFGSLIVALLKTLRAIINSLRSEKGDNLFLFCLNCIVGLIDSLVQYFNVYAYSQIAIYGKSYCDAAKATWRLIKTSGFEAIINDNLIFGAASLGCLGAGILNGFFGGILGYYVIEDYWPFLAAVSFCIGFLMAAVVSEVVESGTITIFVCFIEDREALRRTKPKLYQKFYDTYNQYLV